MRTPLPFVVVAVVLSGCAIHQPTAFGPSQLDASGYGYRFEKIDDLSELSVFEGNSSTSVVDAYIYSILAAQEECLNRRDIGMAIILGEPVNFSESYSYTQVGSYTTTVPGYGGSKPSTQTHVYSYPVTNTFPKYATRFVCSPRYSVFSSVFKFENISKELVHPFVGDFKGGILVNSSSPNGFVEKRDKDPLLEGDVVVSADGWRIQTERELINYVIGLSSSTVALEVIRKKKKITIRPQILNLKFVLETIEVAKSKAWCSHLGNAKQVSICQQLQNEEGTKAVLSRLIDKQFPRSDTPKNKKTKTIGPKKATKV